MVTPATYQPPTRAELERKALRFLRTSKPKAYRAMKAAGELDEVVKGKVDRAEDYARSLVKSGEFEGNAWNRAVRLEILESESD